MKHVMIDGTYYLLGSYYVYMVLVGALYLCSHARRDRSTCCGRDRSTSRAGGALQPSPPLPPGRRAAGGKGILSFSRTPRPFSTRSVDRELPGKIVQGGAQHTDFAAGRGARRVESVHISSVVVAPMSEACG